MKLAADCSTAGKDKFLEGRERLLACIHQDLKPGRIGRGYLRHVGEGLTGGGSQQPPDIEQLVLYPAEFLLQPITG